MLNEMIDLGQRHHRPGAEPRRNRSRRHHPRRLHAARGRRRGPRHRQAAAGAGRQGAARPRREHARRAARRQGPDRQRRRRIRSRKLAPGHHPPPSGQPAGADRHHADRRDDPDRPRPARADHRRPLDRQDDDLHRHDHQPGAAEQGRRGGRRHGAIARSTRIYVAIGQKQSTIARIVACSRRPARMPYTIILASPAADSATSQYLAPFAGAAMGEWFMDNGMDALIVYDDLSKHAVAYRQVSLVLEAAVGPRSLPRRRVLPPQPAARAGGARRREVRQRLAHGAADHRDAGRRRVRLHPDQRHLDHRRPDLSWRPTCSTRASGRRSRSASRCRASARRRSSRR